MSTSVFTVIRAKYNTLSASQKSVADYVLNHADRVMVSSLYDLARASSVSETTVIRFFHNLNFDSYQLLRVNIAQELSRNSPQAIYDEVTDHDSVNDVMNKVIQATCESIKSSAEIIDAEQLAQMIDMIIAAKRILVIGMGASAAIAFDLQHKLLKLGIDACFCNDPHMINVRCLNLTPDDLVVAISHSGESREILDGVHYAKQQKCPVACITSYPNSSVARHSSCVVLSSSVETQYRSDAMTSRIIQLTIIDMIYVCLVVRMGEKALYHVNLSRLAVAGNKT